MTLKYTFSWPGGSASAYNLGESAPTFSEDTTAVRPIGRGPVVLSDGTVTVNGKLTLAAYGAAEIEALDALVAYAGPVEMAGPWDDQVSPATTRTIRILGDRAKTRGGTPAVPSATYAFSYLELEAADVS